MKHQLSVVVAAVILLAATPALGAGYVITAKDRAEAATLSQQAFASFQAGDYAQALTMLERADHLRPDQPDCWNLRGAIYLKLKNYDRAQAAFARAVALDPDLWAARFNVAETQFQRRDYPHARASFERLLAQTDRFKDKSKWELVQYKAFVVCLLMGDDQGANKKLAKLPATDGATPAFLYAQAALSFGRKNPAQAQKALATAQSKFPAAMNDLFSDSLVQVGWISAPQPMAALATNVPDYPTLPGPGGNLAARTPVEIDPALQAASAGPLPVADAPSQPVVAPITPALRNAPAPAASEPKARPHPAPPAIAAQTPAALQLKTGSDLENGGLLLDE